MTSEFSTGGLVVRNFRGRAHLAVVRVRDEILALPKRHSEREIAATTLSRSRQGR